MRTYLFFGQSNMQGFGSWDLHPSPPSLAGLYFYQPSMLRFDATNGQIAALDFDLSRYDFPTSAYDAPINSGFPDIAPGFRRIGPELHAMVDLRAHFGGDVLAIKCAIGATRWDAQPHIAGADWLSPVAWWHPQAQRDWDPANAELPYTTQLIDSGTSTSVAGLVLTDASKSWTPGSLVERWVFIDGKIGIISNNTATQLFVSYWAPIAVTPASGSYEIRRIIWNDASLVHVLTQMAESADAIASGGVELAGIVCSLGENNAATRVALEQMLSTDSIRRTIWHLRSHAVANGLWVGDAADIPVALIEIKEVSTWPYARQVNDEFRRLAAIDPKVVVIPVQHYGYGGYTGSDNSHFNTEACIGIGRDVAEAMIQLEEGEVGHRDSYAMPGRFMRVKPLWAISMGGSRTRTEWVPADYESVDLDLAGPVTMLLPALSGGDRIPVYASRLGASWSRIPIDGMSLVGWGLPAPIESPTMASVGTLVSQQIQSRKQASASRSSTEPQGYGWSMHHPLSGIQGTIMEVGAPSANQTNTLKFSMSNGALARWSFETAGVPAREFVARCGGFGWGLVAELQLAEMAYDETWMDHLMVFGGNRESFTFSGRSEVQASPGTMLAVSPDRIESEIVAMECAGEHGELPAQPVIWPDFKILQVVDPHWRGIEGVHRVMLSLTLPVDLDPSMMPKLRLALHATQDHDKQFLYDPETDTETDLAWSSIDNHRWEIDRSSLTEFTAGIVTDVSASPLSKDVGVLGWSDTSTGFAWGWYVRAGASGSELAEITEKVEIAATPVSGFEDYDQPAYCGASVTADLYGIDLSAGKTIEVSHFLLVGTMAQVRAAAQQLRDLGVDSTWLHD